ncbi:hypothetical protein [Spirosoma sordidisoli]|uniref:Neuropeptide-like protein 29 n=1 Tax=Spirosoma sordidisoli TaxID=2502893 RepID=A0A4Q2UKV4_9BACT|nr:hypothetical protein [Spirosoma sordidisoli]RYC68281.1 hypothetical protein EQG79_18110 [Spirosoma sordidisoli]
MNTIKPMPLLTALMLVVVMASCGPSYVGVRTAPAPAYGYGYGPYYGVRPYPPGYYRRPPVIVQRRTYVVPRGRYYNSRPSYSPNARSNNGYRGNNGYRSNGNAYGRSRGPR